LEHGQQSSLLGIINKQLELMGRYLIEFGVTPAARSRVKVSEDAVLLQEPLTIEFVSPANRHASTADLQIAWKETEA
jgi:hypothetical protein